MRESGKTYAEIQNELQCSKSLISYYCGNNQKEKTLVRNEKYRKTLKGIFKRKKDNFCAINGNRISAGKRSKSLFSAKEFSDKLIANTICYLSGRKINLYKPKTYHCDHITSVSRGGTNHLTNLGVTCREANIAKGTLSVDELLDLCRDILTHHGYTVHKKDD